MLGALDPATRGIHKRGIHKDTRGGASAGGEMASVID
jgi:hypothetical protein